MDHLKEISKTPEGVLVRLKEKICTEIGLDGYKLKTLIDKFVLNVFHGVTTSKTHFAKVNIYNELSKNKMTVKVFFKFLRIINIKSVRISATITTVKNNQFTVYEDVDLFTTTGFEEDIPEINKINKRKEIIDE